MNRHKLCIVILDCEGCSGLCKADIDKLSESLTASQKAAKVVTVKPPCNRELRKELRELNPEGCDRAVIGIWCSPEIFSSANWLPKRFSPSLVDVVDLSVFMSKTANCASQLEKLSKVLQISAAGIANAEALKDRKIPFSSKSVAVIGSNDRAISAAKLLASKGMHVKLISTEAAPNVSGSNLEVIDSVMPEALNGLPGNFKIKFSRKGDKNETDAASVLLVSERCLSKVMPPKDSKSKVVALESFKDYSSSGVKVTGMVFLDDLMTFNTAAEQVTPAWHTLIEAAKTAAANKLADMITVIARDVKAAGLLEMAWKEAAEAGVKFVRFDDKSRPKINKEEPTISVKDLVLGETIDIPADVIVTPTTTRPIEPFFIERLFLPSDWDMKSRLRGPQRGTAQSPVDGVFMIGYAGFNKLLDIPEPELDSAVAQIMSFMQKGHHVAKGAVAVIEEGKCSACLTCVRTCPYRAAIMNDSWKAEIIADKCNGCGNCVAVCPSVAIELKNCTRPQINAQISTSTEVVQ